MSINPGGMLILPECVCVSFKYACTLRLVDHDRYNEWELVYGRYRVMGVMQACGLAQNVWQ